MIGCWNCGGRLGFIPARDSAVALCSTLCRISWARRLRLYKGLGVAPAILGQHRELNAAKRRHANLDLLGPIGSKDCQAEGCVLPPARMRLCAHHAAKIEEAALAAVGRTL